MYIVELVKSWVSKSGRPMIEIVETTLCENNKVVLNERYRLQKEANRLAKMNKRAYYDVVRYETPYVMQRNSVHDTIIEQGKRYTLLKRQRVLCPYIVASEYDSDNGTWCQEHYFNNMKEAADFFYQNDPLYKSI